jgi:lipopolysaccharide/colanic/teichoic acid biosynthesis glycosyltransferase
VKTSLIKEESDSAGPRTFTPRPRHSPSREHSEILPEKIFRRILCWERKKAERSDKLFLLMLVNEGTAQVNRREIVLSEIWSALCGCTRETDIAGWYQHNAVLGVIFTEIDEAYRNTVQNLIRANVTAALCATLSREQAEQIHFSFHLFPEGRERPDGGRLVDPQLYPDSVEQEETRKASRFAKRAIDVVGSIIALILLSPLFVVISLAIKLTSKGPILFKQERVGRYGLQFILLKFRSMECVNDPSIHQQYVRRFIAGKTDSAQPSTIKGVVYKIQEDPRVTRVGKFLRKASLDELPQFINVLKGEMSLVGPRPPIPYELEAYQIWHRRRVLEAKPGITGLWQVSGRSQLKFDDMVRLDLQYARTWSLWLDIKILLQTPRAVLFGAGAY